MDKVYSIGRKSPQRLRKVREIGGEQDGLVLEKSSGKEFRKGFVLSAAKRSVGERLNN